ncbi:MAG: oxygen-independent coproporphyrinogen III oxidase [Alphaproteobacteria bacterium]
MEPHERRTVIAYGEKPVPRYTSYPTANHFGPEVGAQDYRSWLRALKPGSALSLYVHIPFCRSLCWYCGCHTTVTRRRERLRNYTDCLRREIDAVAGLLPGGLRVTHLHFGGGTPTWLDPEDLSGLIKTLRRRFEFSPDAEVAVEVDPRCLTQEMAGALAAGGVTRASLGIQDVSPDVQVRINRIQPMETVAECVGFLRKAGIGRLNFDVMYGLPGQTARHVADTIAATAPFRPARYAVFGYAHVPWFKANQRAIDERFIPGTEERLEQAETAEAALTARGYEALGMDHFALPGDSLIRAGKAGRLRRNFQGYTDDEADVLLGFGASAIGALPQGYVQSEPRIGAYEESVRAGKLPVVRGIALTGEDRLRRAAIERLMCDFTLDAGDLCRRFALSETALDGALAALAPLAADKLVSVQDRTVTVTGTGRRLIRHVAACFDGHLKPARNRHARAV